MAAYGIEYVSPVDVTPTWVTEDQWFTCDVSAYVAAGAIAAVFDVGNSDSESIIGWRHPDSTDEYAFSQEDRSHCMAIVGLDSNLECEFWLDNPDFEVFLVGYIPAGAGEIPVNYVDKSTATTDSWQEIDLSSNITGGVGAAAIMFVRNTSTTNSHWCGIRSTDSSDAEFLRAYRMRACQNILTGLASGELCEQYISNANMDVYYCGAIYSGYISMQNTMTDYSTSTRDSWVDTALSAMAAGSKMAIILAQAGDGSPDERYIKVRKDGDTWDFSAAVFGDMVYVLYMAVGTDADKEIEQYCEDISAYPELYLIGEALEGSSQETYTKTVSLDALIQQTLTKTVSLDAYLSKQFSATLSLDALIYALQTLTADMDALLVKELTQTLSLDALLNKVGFTVDMSLDALLNKVGITTSLSLDAILYAEGVNVYVDALLTMLGVGTLSLDAVLERVGVTVDMSLDALLNKVGITTSLSLDAILQEVGVSTSLSLDACLSYFHLVTVSVDALLTKVMTSSVLLDAVVISIIGAVPKYSFTPDAKPSFTVEARPTFTA